MERQITTHHDGHGLSEKIIICADEPGPGGASHEYKCSTDAGGGYMRSLAYIQYQKGPRNEPGSTAGVLDSVLLAIVADRMRAFQDGPYWCNENAEVRAHVEAAMAILKRRADARAARGVLGKNVK